MDQTKLSVAAAMPVDPEGQDARDARCSMMLRCQLIDGYGRTIPCFLRNISRLGASARGCRGLRTGQRLILILPIAGAIGAIVRWVDGDRFGLLLDEEIEPDELKLAGMPVETHAAFRPRSLHVPVSDFRRPGFKVRSAI